MTVTRGSATAQLARVGFTEPSRAAELLEAPALARLAGDDRLLTALAATADPDAALHGLTPATRASQVRLYDDAVSPLMKPVPVR